MQLGDNLSHHKNLQVITASTASELATVLRDIQLPFSIISIYAQGARHYAWIVPSRPVKIVPKRVPKPKKTKPTKTQTK